MPGFGGNTDARRWLTIFLLWGAGICAAMQFSKISIGYVQFQTALGVSGPSVSALMGAAGIFGLLFGISGADIIGRFELRAVLIWSLLAASALSLAQAVLPPFPLFYALRLCEGATNLFIVIAAPTLIAQTAPRHGVALAMGLWGTFYDVAFAITGALAPLVSGEGGVIALMLAHALFALALAFALKTRTMPDSSGCAATKGGRVGVRSMLLAHRSAYRSTTTALPGMMFFFVSLLYLGFVLFVPLLAPDDRTRDTLNVMLPIMSIFGALSAGPIGTTSCGPARALAIGFPVLGVSAAGLFAVSAGKNDALLYTIMAGISVFTSGVLQGSVFVLVTRLARNATEEATAFGVIAQLGSLGSIVGPLAFAIAIERQALAGFLALVAAAVLLVFPIALASVRAYVVSTGAGTKKLRLGLFGRM